jgi:glutathione S-transferase
MRLYWCAQTRAFRIAWLVEEAGVAYQLVRVNIRDQAATADARFRATSPMGKVPAIEDGSVRLWDSGAICAYVADQYPQSRLAPPIGSADRGAYLQWLMFNNSVIEPAMGEKFGGLPANSSRNGWGSWDQMLETLRSRLATGPWVLGAQFSAADVMLGSACHFLRLFKMVSDDPILFAYADRCAARPAFQRAQGFEG